MTTFYGPPESSMHRAETRTLHGLIATAFTLYRTERADAAATESVTVPLICSALGVPRSDWPLFSQWADELAVPTSRRDFRKTLYGVYAYVDVMVAERCRNLRDDLISKLIMAEFEGDELDSDELRRLVVGALMDVEGSWLAAALAED